MALPPTTPHPAEEPQVRSPEDQPPCTRTPRLLSLGTGSWATLRLRATTCPLLLPGSGQRGLGARCPCSGALLTGPEACSEAAQLLSGLP